jgi:hypothetical protein
MVLDIILNNARKTPIRLDLDAVAGLIAKVQRPSGEIPWHLGGKTDPWDHVEAAMGLTVGGYWDQARQAYQWLAEGQLEDGSWYASYCDGVAGDLTRNSNFCAYIAVGLYHYYLSTGDTDFLGQIWPTIRSAIDFSLNLQAPGGEIYWAISPDGNVDKMALLAGSSAIYMSLKCALAIGALLDKDIPPWQTAINRLAQAIRHRPQHFNMTKSRFSMDWFYPILSGVLKGDVAHQRIHRFWKKFVIKGEGVRCVSDKPWVTIAETAELVLALDALGNRDQARIVFDWICNRRFSDGTYWCGFGVPDLEIWPTEKVTWTNAAMLLAADSLYDLTPGGQLFRHRFWQTKPHL